MTILAEDRLRRQNSGQKVPRPPRLNIQRKPIVFDLSAAPPVSATSPLVPVIAPGNPREPRIFLFSIYLFFQCSTISHTSQACPDCFMVFPKFSKMFNLRLPTFSQKINFPSRPKIPGSFLFQRIFAGLWCRRPVPHVPAPVFVKRSREKQRRGASTSPAASASIHESGSEAHDMSLKRATQMRTSAITTHVGCMWGFQPVQITIVRLDIMAETALDKCHTRSESM